MKSVDIWGDPGVQVSGILDWEPTGEGARARRLPAWTRSQILDPALRMVATMPSGGRIELVTDTTAVELDVLLTQLQMGDEPVREAVFDLVVDGELFGSMSERRGRIIKVDPPTGAMTVERGPAVIIRFDGLGPGVGRLELWLAHNASVEVRAMRVDDGARLDPVPPAGRRWVHYGSSISHCMEASNPTGVWPVVAARLAGVDLTNLGLAGQCHVDQFVARTIRDLGVDLISLKLGINVVNGDTMRERAFLSAVQGFLDTVRDGHPDTPLAIITPIICPAAEDRPGPTVVDGRGQLGTVDRPPAMSLGALSIGRIRHLLAEVVDARHRAGDLHLHLVDGRELFGPGDLDDLPDGLHPNAAGYRRMGERFHRVAFGPSGFFNAAP
ncbi:MAG TPA: GDSL-type esterase/lipase family protein [Acidimicrobiales bacterium]|nr:GDSL-type esterase/lipase family protein [Acidimicrobiales bacterium]